jgi:hypothetical protein
MSSGRDFDSEREQREWDAQERALAAERDGGAAGGDVAFEQYRLVARALRTPQLAVLPLDFAAQTAARARHEARVANETVEVWLERGLVLLLLIVGAAVIRGYGAESLLDFALGVPERAAFGIQTVLGWSLAVAACVGISSVFAFGRR